MNIIERLNIFVKSTSQNLTQLSERTGIPKGSLSQILSGRNQKISNEVLTKFHEAFPNLNILWILFGQGSMLTEFANANKDNESTDTTLIQTNYVKTDFGGDKNTEEEANLFSESFSDDTINETRTEPVITKNTLGNEDNPTLFNQDDDDTVIESTSSQDTEILSDVDISHEERSSEMKSEHDYTLHSLKKKEIEKIIIFYKDKTFDVYQN